MPHRRLLALTPDAAENQDEVPWLHRNGTDTLVDVLVVCAAERTRVVGVAERRLKISVEACAGPAANDALVRYVTRLLGVARAGEHRWGGAGEPAQNAAPRRGRAAAGALSPASPQPAVRLSQAVTPRGRGLGGPGPRRARHRTQLSGTTTSSIARPRSRMRASTWSQRLSASGAPSGGRPALAASRARPPMQQLSCTPP